MVEIKSKSSEVIYESCKEHNTIPQIKRRSNEVIYEGKDIAGNQITDLDLCEADFSRMKLRRTIFSHINLSKADFSHCDLTRAEFHNCNLTGADLSRANLSHVRFEECDLTKANLSYANLEGAVFWLSYLEQTNLSYVRLLSTEFINDQVVSVGGLNRMNSEVLVYNVTNDEVWDEEYARGIPLEEYIPLKKEEVYDRSDEEEQEKKWEPYHHALAFFSALHQSHLKRVEDWESWEETLDDEE